MRYFFSVAERPRPRQPSENPCISSPGLRRPLTGLYVNLVDKVQVQGNVWNGAFNFGVNKNNPFDTGHGYANTLLGVINNDSESDKDIAFDTKYWTVEFYVQDNWRVNKRLTVDYGVRFYHIDLRSFGAAGVNILTGPGRNNWDLSLRKQIPIGLGEGRQIQFRAEAYNAFNHTQFRTLDTGARFDQTGAQVNGNFGAFNSAWDGRVISFTLRLQF